MPFSGLRRYKYLSDIKIRRIKTSKSDSWECLSLDRSAHVTQDSGGSSTSTQGGLAVSANYLDPSHQFDSAEIRHLLERRELSQSFAQFALVRRMGATLVKNINRDMTELVRLSGCTDIKVGNKAMDWWDNEIGLKYQQIPEASWGAARTVAISDMQVRGFVVERFVIAVSPTRLRIKWQLSID